MNLAHGDRVLEKAEIKRETLSPKVCEEDWDDRPSHYYSKEKMTGTLSSMSRLTVLKARAFQFLLAER